MRVNAVLTKATVVGPAVLQKCASLDSERQPQRKANKKCSGPYITSVHVQEAIFGKENKIK